ncbi:DUF7557 family protein [Halovenus salina]|uniref:Antitoxin VapB family protein n=1 Tax=Halovenus salina TaxID=1510225 RepID=A0ABD5W2I1_9EURY|nr:antitoxin VapB family protein [Halovenus salina]
MGSTSIRVSDETKDRLDLFKREDESYEDVILRLTERDKWTGFGVLSDAAADTDEGMDNIREELRTGTTDDIEGQQ